MNLYVCSSAYQLLNAINLAQKEMEKPDLLIIKRELLEICNIDILKNQNYFGQIYLWYELLDSITDDNIKVKIDKVKIVCKKIFLYLNVKKIQKSLPNIEKSYTTIYISYADFPSQCIYYYFKKKGSLLNLYEDGTYTYECLAVKPSFIRRVVSKFLFSNYIMDDCAKIWVRKKEQVNLGKYHNISVGEIINNYNNEILQKSILAVFKADSANIDMFLKKCIIFDQNIEIENVKKKQKEIADLVKCIIGKDNLLIKMHPASRDVEYSSDIVKFYSRVPFEVIMNSFSMEEKILISIFSTACFSPKLIMNQEPYIIFTYKIIGNMYTINPQFLEMIDKIKASYSEPKKIFIPETLDELERNILEIKMVLNNERK